MPVEVGVWKHFSPVTHKIEDCVGPDGCKYSSHKIAHALSEDVNAWANNVAEMITGQKDMSFAKAKKIAMQASLEQLQEANGIDSVEYQRELEAQQNYNSVQDKNTAAGITVSGMFLTPVVTGAIAGSLAGPIGTALGATLGAVVAVAIIATSGVLGGFIGQAWSNHLEKKSLDAKYPKQSQELLADTKPLPVITSSPKNDVKRTVKSAEESVLV